MFFLHSYMYDETALNAFFVILMDFVLVRVRWTIEDFLFFTVQFNFFRALLTIYKKCIQQVLCTNNVV